MFTESMDNTRDTLKQTLQQCNRIRYTVKTSERTDGLPRKQVRCICLQPVASCMHLLIC